MSSFDCQVRQVKYQVVSPSWDFMLSRCTCRYNARLKEIELNPDDTVKCFKMADGTTIEGDLYVSAMPGTLLAGRNPAKTCFFLTTTMHRCTLSWWLQVASCYDQGYCTLHD